jgi:hypothetical protein
MLKAVCATALTLALLLTTSGQARAETIGEATNQSCDSNGNCQGQQLKNPLSGDSGTSEGVGNTSPKQTVPATTPLTPYEQALRRLAETQPTKRQKATLESQLRQVATKLKLPNPTPRFGPDPSVNEWKMLAVGFPVWLWTDSPRTVTSTATNDGLTFTLKATWTSTTFNLGDGHTKTCTNTSVYPAHIDKPGSPSPTCGYIYDAASPKGHPYTVSAETHWRIDWSTGGQAGSFDHIYTGNRTLEIGELASMIKR